MYLESGQNAFEGGILHVASTAEIGLLRMPIVKYRTKRTQFELEKISNHLLLVQLVQNIDFSVKYPFVNQSHSRLNT